MIRNPHLVIGLLSQTKGLVFNRSLGGRDSVTIRAGCNACVHYLYTRQSGVYYGLAHVYFVIIVFVFM